MTLIASSFGAFRAKNVGLVSDLFTVYDAAMAQYSRFEDAYRALEWLLAHDAEQTGKAITLKNGLKCRLYKQAGVFGSAPVPEITVIFTVDANDVEIMAMRVTDPEPSDEEIEL